MDLYLIFDDLKKRKGFFFIVLIRINVKRVIKCCNEMVKFNIFLFFFVNVFLLLVVFENKEVIMINSIYLEI